MRKLPFNSSKILLAAAIFLTPAIAGISSPITASAASAAVVTQPATIATGLGESAEQYALFLKDKFNITFAASITRGDLISAVATALTHTPNDTAVVFEDLDSSSAIYKDAVALYQQGIITSKNVNANTRISAASAILLAIKAANLEELAYTYPEAKVTASLAKLNWKGTSIDIQSDAAKLLAAAVDTGLLPSEYYNEVRPNAPVSASLSAVLLGKILEANGQYKHYIGRSTDSDILLKLNDAYATSDIIKAPELQKVVDEALKQDLVTGYNLKDNRFDSHFVDSHSLVYGHSDLKHALQLIGLLRSENIDAKIQFEPKTSAFIYLKEWGEPGISDLYEVVQIENGNYIEYAKEYDIAFEFNNTEDKSRFNQIILTYAKKNEDDQPGLISGSWWQPLYFSLTELKDYETISNNTFSDGNYYAQSFSLKENSADVIAGFKQLDPTLKIDSYNFWVDGPFYNYLNGEAK
jgi:hypothetical protein